MNLNLKFLGRHGLSLTVAALALSGISAAFADPDGDQGAIRVLSGSPDMVSGGKALVEVEPPHYAPNKDVRVTLNGQDITGEFRSGQSTQSLVGLVSGLIIGKNRIDVLNHGQHSAMLAVTNFPVSGPIFSGPQQKPFICQTQTFVLNVTGGTLGPPLDANCSTNTRVDYVYGSIDGTLKPLPNAMMRPNDLATTTTSRGVTVNYIVRVETGTINRAVYRLAVLHDPVTDPSPDPWNRPAGWNGSVLYAFGGGCGTGHHQGQSLGIDSDVLNHPQLGNAGLANG
jgi:hypothetical protein